MTDRGVAMTGKRPLAAAAITTMAVLGFMAQPAGAEAPHDFVDDPPAELLPADFAARSSRSPCCLTTTPAEPSTSPRMVTARCISRSISGTSTPSQHAEQQDVHVGQHRHRSGPEDRRQTATTLSRSRSKWCFGNTSMHRTGRFSSAQRTSSGRTKPSMRTGLTDPAMTIPSTVRSASSRTSWTTTRLPAGTSARTSSRSSNSRVHLLPPSWALPIRGFERAGIFRAAARESGADLPKGVVRRIFHEIPGPSFPRSKRLGQRTCVVDQHRTQGCKARSRRRHVRSRLAEQTHRTTPKSDGQVPNRCAVLGPTAQ
jgi:hypothetical protein